MPERWPGSLFVRTSDMNNSQFGPLRGRLLMALSALAFACMGMTAKAVPAPASSHEKVFFRSLIGTVLILAWIWLRRGKEGRPKDHRRLFLRGALGAAALLCFFYSIDHAGLTRATLYYYTYPVWAAALAWFDRHERPSAGVLGWLGLAVLGVIVTLTPSGGASWKEVLGRGDMVGLAGGALSGSAITSVRRLHRTDNSTWIVLAFTSVSTAASLPFMAPSYVPPGPAAVLLLLATGILAVASQSLMTAGYRFVPAVEGSLYGLSAVPVSAVLGMVAFGEELRTQFWGGAVLVFAAAAGSTLQATRRRSVPKKGVAASASLPEPAPAEEPEEEMSAAA